MGFGTSKAGKAYSFQFSADSPLTPFTFLQLMYLFYVYCKIVLPSLKVFYRRYLPSICRRSQTKLTVCCLSKFSSLYSDKLPLVLGAVATLLNTTSVFVTSLWLSEWNNCAHTGRIWEQFCSWGKDVTKIWRENL
jgi:hypothetical protein